MSLPNVPDIDFRTELLTQGIGSTDFTSDWSVFNGNEPSTPERSITCYTFQGPAPNPKFLLEEVNIHIRVRGKPNDYTVAYNKIQEIKDGFLGLAAKTIGGSKYVRFLLFTDPGFLGYTDNDQPIWTCDFQLTREPTNTSTESERESF